MTRTKKSVLLSLLKRQWLTPLEAVDRVGILSLSQRCGEFRREGWRVLDKWVPLASGSKVKSYRIAGRA